MVPHKFSSIAQIEPPGRPSDLFDCWLSWSPEREREGDRGGKLANLRPNCCTRSSSQQSPGYWRTLPLTVLTHITPQPNSETHRPQQTLTIQLHLWHDRFSVLWLVELETSVIETQGDMIAAIKGDRWYYTRAWVDSRSCKQFGGYHQRHCHTF